MKKQDTLLRIMEGTSPATGEDFFAAPVKNLSQSMGVAAAWVTEYSPDFQKLQNLAFWLDGRRDENMDGPVKGTPCEVVINKGAVLFVADEVTGEFPDAPDLISLGMSSHIGIPFKDNDRQVFGHLAVMDRKPMPDKQAALSLMRIFASRAAHLTEVIAKLAALFFSRPAAPCTDGVHLLSS